ncbi:MAG: glucosamine-6-phosphate deaminase [Treponema sp.]|jgi:6-phosphogluconolactonase/glucosamine-6-phosphate isomerase/deaminase|nr:glucosamine-6-phosphate deaminase [Treponema sp.]
MKLLIEQSYEALSEKASGIMLAVMAQDKRVNIAITAGNSPILTYEKMIAVVKATPDSFANVHYYNFDEIPHKGKEKGVTLTALDALYFKAADIPASRIHPLTCDNYATHYEAIVGAGGLDLMLIGMGGDGHFCGNMPEGTRFEEYIYRMHIKKEYPWYEGITQMGLPEIPEYFVTMGAAAVMKVRHLVMIVNGASKAHVVKRFFESTVDPSFPSSVLKLHPNFTLILDKDAASLL